MMFIRKVKTASGATAVQIAFKEKGKIVRIMHIGSAHTDEDLRVLLAIAHNKLHAKQPELFPEAASGFRVEIRQTYSGLLWKILQQEYQKLGFAKLRDDSHKSSLVFWWIKTAFLWVYKALKGIKLKRRPFYQ